MDTAPEIIRVRLLGAEHAVVLPRSIIEQEELYTAWREVTAAKKPGMRTLRIACALVGMCTRVGRHAGVTYDEAGSNPAAYGGRIYDWMVDHGGTDGVVAAAVAIDAVLTAALLARAEAPKKAAFFARSAEPVTEA